MIYVTLIIFFISLFSILFMLGRKLLVLGNTNYYIPEDAKFELPYVEESRDFLIKNIKRLEHVTLVFVVRFFIQSKNVFKNVIEDIKNLITRLHFKVYPNGEFIEKIENSKILKLISRYRQKIRIIIKQIKKEENNM